MFSDYGSQVGAIPWMILLASSRWAGVVPLKSCSTKRASGTKAVKKNSPGRGNRLVVRHLPFSKGKKKHCIKVKDRFSKIGGRRAASYSVRSSFSRFVPKTGDY